MLLAKISKYKQKAGSHVFTGYDFSSLLLIFIQAAAFICVDDLITENHDFYSPAQYGKPRLRG
jgi:hypothetical protein